MGNPAMIDDVRREVLLSDLRNWNESFWKNEGAGESRIKFYITLVTAVGGGLSALHQIGLKGEAEGSAARAAFQHLVPVALVVVLLFGFMTFARMVRRNQVTDEYKVWGDAIRRHLLEAPLFERIYGPRRPASGRRDLWNGGLASMMLVMNGVVAGILFGFLVLPAGHVVAWITGPTAFLFTCWAQTRFLDWRHRRAIEKKRGPEELQMDTSP